MDLRKCVKWVSTLCLFLLTLNARGQTVVVNEIMYHPASTNLLEQWFEILNTGTAPADLSSWRVTKGVSYTFPTNTILGPGAYLVVAADGPTFHSHFPSVANYVAGWIGKLGHVIELSDASGQVVHSVNFYSEGDWAERVLGEGGIPGQVDTYGGLGWSWFALHDGFGASLELINAGLPNRYGANWASNTATNATPGKLNSVATNNIAPIITEVSHTPSIPRPAESVTITAKVIDESNVGLVVDLHWRLDGAASFETLPMFDDATHGDGVAGDGVFAVILPPQPNTTIVEFYLTATDSSANTRTYPHFTAPADSSRTANLLYQVDSSSYGGAQPIYRVVMTDAERLYLETLSNNLDSAKGATTDSDANVNITWITTDGVVTDGTTTQLRYNAGLRNRGHGSRTSRPHNFHVNIPDDRLWKKQAGINLNSQYAHSQVLGSAIFRKLELPMADARGVQLRLNGINQMTLSLPNINSYGSYTANEQYNNDYVKRSWPLDPEGNSYRGIRDAAADIKGLADLTWHGSNPFVSAYTNAYFKQNNTLENDWSDLIRLLSVLNVTNGTTLATYVSDVEKIINVDQWMQYMAVSTLIANNETCLANGIGDDYALYRGALDPRFQALPYDLDTVMGEGGSPGKVTDSLFRMTALPAMDRFMKTPTFASRYYYWLRTYAQGAFSPAEMNPLIDRLLNTWAPLNVIDRMKAFNAARATYVLSQIPTSLTVTSSLPLQNGYPRTTTAQIDLGGAADPVATRSVVVNGSPATYIAWQGRWTNTTVTVRPGLNHLLVQALDMNGKAVQSTTIDVWFDDGTVQAISAPIAANTLWSAAGGPYNITANLTINSGATLTIQPGASVYLAAGVNLTVANGGRLLAEGTAEAPILFTRVPGGTGTWGGIVINGGAGSPESKISHAHFEFNGSTAIHSTGGTVSLTYLTFGATDRQYISLDGSSFLVSDCVFPNATAQFEPVHGTGGIKAGGRGLFLRNFFGSPIGYNDVVDFTGCNRPGPIVHFINNVFTGATDDMLDLDGTDAWVEGNIFLHVHKNGAPDSSSAVSGGNDSGQTSEVTIIHNLFFDCDQAATAKQGNFFTLINNTIVRQSHQGGLDTDGAVVNVADDGTTEGAGMYLEGNVIVDAEKLVRNLKTAIITYTNNILPLPWTGPGGNNSSANPLLKHIPQLAETNFKTFEEAQILRDWFSLLPGSPARGTGPNGSDMGGVVSRGASISGTPIGKVNQTTATLTAGTLRTGNGIPTAGFPAGSGFTHYRWRLDGGLWSAETPIQTPTQLSSLANGPHQVEVIGKMDSGLYQNDDGFAQDAIVSSTPVWTVDTAYVAPALPTIRINEILAKNSTTLTNGTTTPDLIELFNYGKASVDLSGMGLTDNASLPYKYTFPAGTSLPPNSYLVLFADSGKGGAYAHTGFTLKQSGDDVSLFAKPSPGTNLIDSIRFGIQLEDASIGRRADGTWGLCRPTFGSENLAARTGDPSGLRINEWLTDAQFVSKNDFIELYNSGTLPVDLSGLYLSDAAGSPARHRLDDLSFIAAKGLLALIADGDTAQGSDHLNFKLSPEVGLILLSSAQLETLDSVVYGPQNTDLSEGRSPDGSDTFTRFAESTPGSGNPGTKTGDCVIANETIALLPLNAVWRYNETENLDGVNWFGTGYNDQAWPEGPGLLAVEDCNCLPTPPGIQTPLTIGRLTYYFRTSFVVKTNLTGFNLNVRTVVDDGVVLYLNGNRILTNGMNTGTPLYGTAASRNVGNASVEFFTLPPTFLVNGTNVLAAEVHQINNGSSDITWGLSIDATRSFTNCNPGTGISVVLNEVLASNVSYTNLNGRTSDYVELHNSSSAKVDLSNLSLTDDPGFPRKWVFPAGASIEGNGYLVVTCDGGQPVSSSNTGFNLNAEGGAILLFNAPATGGSLVDGLRYGLQTPDFSLARVPNGTGNWTLGVPTTSQPNVAAGLGSVSGLRINEWVADPVRGSDWFEVVNTESQPVPLSGLFLTDDLANKTQSALPPLSFIGTGASGFVQFFADGSPSSGARHVAFSLKKSGEALGIFTPAGVLVNGLSFGAQVTGVSQGRFPDGSTNIVSFPNSSSPEESNYLPLNSPWINEILAHTDAPLEDAIELFNPLASPVNIGGWYLSNSKQNLKKFRIPDGTIIPAKGYLVIYEASFSQADGVPFTFNSAHGDTAILSEALAAGQLTGYRNEIDFPASENGVSFGRYTTSIGVDFVAQRSRTFGSDTPTTLADFRTGKGLPNSGPKIGPVVITEINYLTSDATGENGDLEFIELQNLSSSPTPLFDPIYSTNTWSLHGAVDFDFPQGVTLAGSSRLLLVGFDPSNLATLTAFKTKFAVPAGVQILGPWLGRLQNDLGTLDLIKPDAVQLPPHPDAGFVPQIVVDHVRYTSTAPWPAANDGATSLQKLVATDYGNDPIHWKAAAPTAGRDNGGGGNPDSDGDGLLDSWELANFGTLDRDGTGDFDNDGSTDLEEFLAGTDPKNSGDRLHIESGNYVGNSFVLRFGAVAGKTYTLLRKEAVESSAWVKVADVGPVGSTGPIDVTDATASSASIRFYRIVTPSQP